MDRILEGGSPFVTVMQVIGIPYADSILNFVVIIGSWLGALLMAALLVTTLFTQDFIMTLVFGVPFAAVVAGLYLVMRRKMRPFDDAPGETDSEHDALKDSGAGAR